MDRDLATLQDHAAVLARRWRLLTVFVLLGVAAGLGLSMLQSPVYTASSTLLVQSSDPSQSRTSSPALDAEDVATEAQVVLSDPVAGRVIRHLHLHTQPADLLETVTAEPASDERIVVITATRPTAAGAARVADSFARSYIELKDSQARQADTRIRDSYVSDLSDIQVKLDNLRKTGGAAAETQAQTQSLLARQAELQASLLVAENPTSLPTANGQVLHRAEQPVAPSDPRPLRAGLLGGVLGLVIGVLVGYARDRADDRVRSGQRLEDVSGSAPVLGRIPTLPRVHQGRVEVLLDPQSAGSEAFRTLSTNLRFLLAADPSDLLEDDPLANLGGIVVVTSPSPHEGKTSVATNVAVAAARTGLRVLLVDADMRNPRVAERFGLDLPAGLAEHLAGDKAVHRYFQDVGVPNLTLLAAGSVPPNPAELLATPRARVLWRELRQTADLVIVDTPPLLPVADTLEVVGDADHVVLVVRDRESRLRHLRAAISLLRQVSGPFSGLVHNGLPGKEVPYRYTYERQPRAAETTL